VFDFSKFSINTLSPFSKGAFLFEEEFFKNKRRRKMKVKIEKLDVKNKKFLRKCAELYCQIWKEPPWNEDFWTVEGVIEDIKKQMERPNAVGFWALYGEEVIGFTWGYEVSKADLREISGVVALDFLFKKGSRVFYIDELGVAYLFRGRGIGERLSRNLIGAVRNSCEIRRFTLRTDIKAITARNLYRKLGFRDLLIRDAAHPNRTYWFLELP